jgi:autotransporter-associated beta strand protein
MFGRHLLDFFGFAGHFPAPFVPENESVAQVKGNAHKWSVPLIWVALFCVSAPAFAVTTQVSTQNYGISSLTLDSGDELQILGSGSVNVSGEIQNMAGGLVDNAGTLTNSAGATIENQGTLVNSGTLVNQGTITTVSGGLQDYNGVIVNDGLISGDGTAISCIGGVNTVEIEAGSSIVGKVIAFSRADSLDLNGPGAVFDVSTIGSQYQGFGIFEVTGGATWTLAGASGLLTPWSVDQSALLVSSNGALGLSPGVLTLVNGALIWGAAFNSDRPIIILARGALDTAGFDATWSGTISGTGCLAKTGQGVLTLDAVETYGGGTQVGQGTLQVGDSGDPGAEIPGSVNVSGFGILAGYGTVEGPLFNDDGGTVAPGFDGVGTLRVGGNYQQAALSSLLIEITPRNASSLVVAGSANLDGTLQLVYAPGIYVHGGKYTILSADGGVSGSFAQMDGSNPGSSASLNYLADSVELTVGPSQVGPTNDSVFAALNNVALVGADLSSAALFRRVDGLTCGWDAGSDVFAGDLASESGQRTGAWERNTGYSYRANEDGAVAGYNALGGGIAAGMDRRWGGVLGGFSVGDSATDVNLTDGENGAMDAPGVAVYGGLVEGPLCLDASLGYAYDSFTASRPIPSLGQSASSGFGGQEASGAIQAGLPLGVGDLILLPKAALSYAGLFDSRFSENGSPDFDLSVAGQDSRSLKPFVGLSAYGGFRFGGWVLAPDADLGWTYETLAEDLQGSASAGGGTFGLAGVTPAPGAFTVGGGLTARVARAFSLNADYQVATTGNTLEQTLSLGMRYEL